MALRVAYVVDEWVTLSQTFIREEVAELRRQGVVVEVIALEHGDSRPAADEPATYLVDRLPSGRLARLLPLLRHPVRAARLLRTQASMRPERVRYRATLPDVASGLDALDVRWIHAHFGWEAAGVAEALAGMLDLGWSFTAHANDIFVANDHLAGKLARADRLVTVCQYNLDHLRETFAALPPTEVIVCGVELPDPQPGPRAATPVDVLAVGRLVPKKGFDLLVRAAAHLRAERPQLRVEIVGDGPEEEHLRALVHELDLEGVVHLVGPLDHDAVLDRMSSTAIVCLPARIAEDGDRDSMPVVLKEAMARAVPVVATAVVAIPEMVDDEVGRLVPPNDPAALATALAALLADEPLRRSLGEHGRARVADRFTLAGEVGKLRARLERWAGAAR